MFQEVMRLAFFTVPFLAVAMENSQGVHVNRNLDYAYSDVNLKSNNSEHVYPFFRAILGQYPYFKTLFSLYEKNEAVLVDTSADILEQLLGFLCDENKDDFQHPVFDLARYAHLVELAELVQCPNFSNAVSRAKVNWGELSSIEVIELFSSILSHKNTRWIEPFWDAQKHISDTKIYRRLNEQDVELEYGKNAIHPDGFLECRLGNTLQFYDRGEEKGLFCMKNQFGLFWEDIAFSQTENALLMRDYDRKFTYKYLLPSVELLSKQALLKSDNPLHWLLLHVGHKGL